MNKVNGNDMHFILKKRGHSPERDQLRQESNRILKPNKTQVVGRGSENKRIQEYRPSQERRKQIDRINILIHNRFLISAKKLEKPIQGISRKRERILAKPVFR